MQYRGELLTPYYSTYMYFTMCTCKVAQMKKEGALHVFGSTQNKLQIAHFSYTSCTVHTCTLTSPYQRDIESQRNAGNGNLIPTQLHAGFEKYNRLLETYTHYCSEQDYSMLYQQWVFIWGDGSAHSSG